MRLAPISRRKHEPVTVPDAPWKEILGFRAACDIRDPVLMKNDQSAFIAGIEPIRVDENQGVRWTDHLVFDH